MSLLERIRAEIEAGGPMPFERFMELSLYDSESGFFGSGQLRSVKSGDFLTSPEVSSLFGETIGEFLDRERERIGEPFQVVEVAAGSGSLLLPLLKSGDFQVKAIEASPAARQALTDRGVEVVEQLPDVIRGVVIANELVDNLPMALAQLGADGWRERWVGIDGDSLSFVDSPARDEVLDWLDLFSGEVGPGGWVEVQIEAFTWVEDTVARLQAGSVVVIDYGDTAEGLEPRRQDGTLRTYRSHHLGPHPLDEPGSTDITADVNFSALVAAAQRAGASTELVRQDDFLTTLGLRDRLSSLRSEALEAARAGDSMRQLRLKSLATEAETLLHPRGLGDFRVLVARK